MSVPGLVRSTTSSRRTAAVRDLGLVRCGRAGSNEEVLAVETGGYRPEPSDGTHDDVLIRIGVVGFHHQHLHGRDDEERTEDVQDPVELGDQLGPNEDHDSPQDQGPEHAPEQDPVLVEWAARQRSRRPWR